MRSECDAEDAESIDDLPRNKTLDFYETKAFTDVHGKRCEMEKLEHEFQEFSPEQWREYARALIYRPFDSDTATPDDAIRRMHSFYALFSRGMHKLPKALERMEVLFPDPSSMKQEFERMVNSFMALKDALMKLNMLVPEEKDVNRATLETARKMNHIAFCMKLGFEGMTILRVLQQNTDPHARSMLQDCIPTNVFQPFDLGRLKTNQALIYFYLHRAFSLRYRKSGDMLFKPKLSQDQVYVYAYEYEMDITEFVWRSLYPIDQNTPWVEAMTQNQGTPRQCVDVLTKLESEYLPVLKTNWKLHAFRNGLLCIDPKAYGYDPRLAFATFVPTEGYPHVGNWNIDLEGELIASKYHDMEFNMVAMVADMKSDYDNFMDIEIPGVDEILVHQGFDKVERMWIYALLGRMFFPLHLRDNFGVMPFLIGLASCGKSLLYRLLASCFESKEVGYFNNALQTTFALEHIYDKRVFFGLDIDSKFRLDQATFQSMVVAEDVNVARKYKTALDVVWGVPGGFAGNVLPDWQDNGGSVARRLVTLEFKKRVLNVDTSLFQRCKHNKDRFIYVISRAYGEILRLCQNQSFKARMPQKFRDSEESVLKELKSFDTWLTTYCKIDADDTPAEKKSHVLWKDLTKMWKNHHIQNNLQRVGFTSTLYNNVFLKYSLQILDRGNDKVKEKLVMGLDISPAGHALLGAEK